MGCVSSADADASNKSTSGSKRRKASRSQSKRRRHTTAEKVQPEKTTTAAAAAADVPRPSSPHSVTNEAPLLMPVTTVGDVPHRQTTVTNTTNTTTENHRNSSSAFYSSSLERSGDSLGRPPTGREPPAIVTAEKVRKPPRKASTSAQSNRVSFNSAVPNDNEAPPNYDPQRVDNWLDEVLDETSPTDGPESEPAPVNPLARIQ